MCHLLKPDCKTTVNFAANYKLRGKKKSVLWFLLSTVITNKFKGNLRSKRDFIHQLRRRDEKVHWQSSSYLFLMKMHCHQGNSDKFCFRVREIWSRDIQTKIIERDARKVGFNLQECGTVFFFIRKFFFEMNTMAVLKWNGTIFAPYWLNLMWG